MEKVSILMPNYNHEMHLKEAIVSCLSQTYKNIELIITDSSTDNSMKIIESFRDDKRVSVYHKDGLWSLPQKLNFLIDKAKGEYVKFFWSDDIMVEDCLEKNINFAKENDLDFVNIDMSWIDFNGKEIRKAINKEMFNIKGNLITENNEKNLNYFVRFGEKGPFAIGPNSLFAKLESLKKVGKFVENLVQEDVPFVYKMHSQKFRIGYINEPLWKFRYFIEKDGTSDLQGQSTKEHFKMRIYCMNLAIKSGKLDKIALKIAKKRIETYKAEIFQSKHKYIGLIWLFYKRYQPILVKYYFIFKKKEFNLSNYVRFTISDSYRRVKMVSRGLKNPQCYY